MSRISKGSSILLSNKVKKFQQKRLYRLLKSIAVDWKKRQSNKCQQYKTVSKQNAFKKCFFCLIDNKNKCEDCGKLILKENEKAYDFNYKFVCEKCS